MDEADLLRRITELERRLDWLYRATGYGSAYPGTAAATAAPPPDAVSGVSAEVLDLVRQGRKINAIKVYREQTGVSLKEAKDVIDRLR